MDRRSFLKLGAAAAAGAGAAAWAGGRWRWQAPDVASMPGPPPPAFSIIPVVADGRWIWKEPPSETGYLEPRPYSLQIGIELQGRGPATGIKATTTVPVECPEQKIEEEQVVAQGCRAAVRQLGPQARQLCLFTPQIGQGQVVSAAVRCRLLLSKQYLAYRQEQFPDRQQVPPDVRRQYLGDSPGIETRASRVRQLLERLRGESVHPWDLAARFASWVPRNIRPQIGPYTGVVRALDNRRGDCEEMAAVFVALCRAADIPARLVWIPNHNWAEFYLTDHEGQGHWIPAHVACYFWFGWTGAHELVLQKGDRIRVPERGRLYRLLEDWMQWSGARPTVRYLADLRPEPPSEGSDPGPGHRTKIASGEWKLAGDHPLDRYMRR